jgi:predicted acylesterase/phospholipase RssA
MSASYPLFFQAVFRDYINSAGKKSQNVIMDGGILDNYPLHVLREQGVPDRKMLGLKLCSTDGMKEYKVESGTNAKYDFGKPDNVLDATIRLISLMRKTAMKLHVKSKDWMLTAKINVKDLSSMDFDITQQEMRDVYECGKISIDQLIVDTAEHLEAGTYP